MTIRARLIIQTVFLQVISVLLLANGVFAVQHTLGEKDVALAETQIRLAVARTATDALIQKDQVQLLSYLNFLKVQYPALAYARIAVLPRACGLCDARQEIAALADQVAFGDRVRNRSFIVERALRIRAVNRADKLQQAHKDAIGLHEGSAVSSAGWSPLHAR